MRGYYYTVVWRISRSAVGVLDRLHRHESRCAGNVGQAGDLFAQHDAVATDVGRAHLEQIVEAAGDHVAFLDFRQAPHRRVELAQGLLARVGQFYFGEGDMIEAEAGRIDDGTKAPDHARIQQAAQANLARRLADADFPREVGHSHAPVFPQSCDDFSIDYIQIDLFVSQNHSHGPK
ncbi:hypothetical protein SPHV1_230118 [Novosphingobium sp. KN65.2]|nr:hypothetical protein SPHV1_230118 [Novosphingobium sp. KN65.2]